MKYNPSSKLAIVFSVLLHAVIFTFLFINLSSPNNPTERNVQIVQAVAINSSQLVSASQKKLETQQPVVEHRKVVNEQLVEKTKPLPEDTIRKIEQMALKQQDVEKLPVKKDVIKQEIVTPSKPLPKQEVKSEHTATAMPAPKIQQKVSKQVDLQPPILEEQPEAKKQQEAKRRAELQKQEEKLVRQQREEEAKQLQKELAEAKEINSKAEEKTTSSEDAAKEDISQALNEEKQQLSEAASQVASAGEIDKFKQMIIQSISRKWLIPDTENQDLACQLLVHVGPGGVVLSVDILKESGDANLDRSARNAIMKASPLPVPESAELFDNFRALRLTFRPQGIVSN